MYLVWLSYIASAKHGTKNTIQLRIGVKKMNTPQIIYEFPLLIRTALRAFLVVVII